MKKHGIKASQAPKGEYSKFTIAAQDKQISLLIDRCQTLVRNNQELEKQRDAIDQAFKSQMEMAGSLADKLSAVQASYTRLLGWQDCARELLVGGRKVEITGRRIEPFPSNAPGF